MKLVIQTYYRENYGIHDWDGNGECPQYWKNKAGSEFIVEEYEYYDMEQVKADISTILDLIEYKDEATEQGILSWSIEDNDYIPSFEKDQLEYEGFIQYFEPRITLDEDIASLYKKNTNNTKVQNDVINLVSTQSENDAGELNDIMRRMNKFHSREEKLEHLSEVYGLGDEIEYLFLGQIKQSIMNNDIKNNDETVSFSEIVKKEKNNIDLFVYAQKDEMLEKIDGDAQDVMEDKEILFQYIYSNLINVISSSKGNIINFKDGRINEFEIVELIISDLFDKKLEDTEYIKYLSLNGVVNEDKKNLVNKVLEQALFYVKEVLHGNIVVPEEYKERFDNILKVIKNIDAKEPKATIGLGAGYLFTNIRDIQSQVKSTVVYEDAFNIFKPLYDTIMLMNKNISNEDLEIALKNMTSGMKATFDGDFNELLSFIPEFIENTSNDDKKSLKSRKHKNNLI